jgi:hypothetical protein
VHCTTRRVHENDISGATDVAQKFSERKTIKTIDGKEIGGYFTEDFTLTRLSEHRVARLSLRIVLVARHEHTDAPHALLGPRRHRPRRHAPEPRMMSRSRFWRAHDAHWDGVMISALVSRRRMKRYQRSRSLRGSTWKGFAA